LARLGFTGVSEGAQRSALVFALLLLALLVPAAGLAYAATPQEDLAGANASVQKALVAARAGDVATAKQAYDQYENTWFDVEDGVRGSSREAYVAIEKAMTGVATSFAATPPQSGKVVEALAALDREQQAFISGRPASGSGVAAANGGAAATSPATATGGASAVTTGASGPPTMAGVVGLLSDAQAALGRNDYATATARLKAFGTSWLDVEGEVKTRSADDYRQTETDMALAESLAGQQSPQANEVVTRMINRLQPYTQTQQQYGIFDATIILLREGLEALLVVVALSAFLKKSGNRTGEAWLWSGAVVGLLLSVVLGVGIQAFFGAIINSSNREIMEGIIGLFAAAMLIYVSYWLHSKASLGGWQSYITTQTRQAIGGGRMFGLAVLAFLAVFREGAETALFYLGMASNISNSDLFIGLGLGFAMLTVLGVLMVVVGLRIPMRPFFTVASLLVFYLCFKFVGMGIHALQVAGAIPSGSAPYLPSLDIIGLYPTWPTTIAQLVLLAAGLWVVLRDRIGGEPRSPGAPVLTSTSRQAGVN
jgi:high-affinity iron transporter